MLPQIVEVVKNIHHITEVNSLGVAVDVDINVQT
jgi:2-methylisocitrate lyase-like PEP mutase family enzyme